MSDKTRRLTIQDLVMLTTLGTGTFGRVRLVKFKGNPRSIPLALKMLKKSVVLKLKQVDHITSEKAILERVQHPFVIRLLDTFQDEAYLYMLFEFVSGGELFSRLRREGRFANDVALFYTCEILLVFEYLHGMQVAYRDLKPENILIDRQGHIKITDFGFAKVMSEKTYTLCGTPEYLAPEIIKGQGHGIAVDWWALGILIYEMIAGFPPFYAENPYEIYDKILSGRIEFSKVFNVKVKDLIKKFLQAKPMKRYGAHSNGVDAVKSHKWFRGVDWNRVYRREIPPPWQPRLSGPEDTHLFDTYPDSLKPAERPRPSEADIFRNF